MNVLTGVTGKDAAHTDLTKARISKNAEDTRKLVSFLSDKKPFSLDLGLRNIANGMTAEDKVNVFRAKEIGELLFKDMDDKLVEEYSISKNMLAVNFSSKAKVSIEGLEIFVDPKLLFQRLIILAEGDQASLDDVLQHEMTSYPPSLFENVNMFRPANKSQLSDGLLKMLSTEHIIREELPEGYNHYVLDGGSLLHRLHWPKRTTYSDLINIYAKYIRNKYSTATVIFDEYPSYPTIKDTVHMRRKAGTSRRVDFTPDMYLATSKEVFL